MPFLSLQDKVRGQAKGKRLTINANFPADSTIIIAAFGGWSDAGASATDAVSHLIEVWDAKQIYELPIDSYYDFSFNRPEISTDENGVRQIAWPGTKIYSASATSLPNTKIFLIQGDEPNLKWTTYANALLDEVNDSTQVSTVLITLGSMLAEVPHTRPVPINGTTFDPQLQELTGYGTSNYEGPTGIISVLSFEAQQRGIPAASIWAALPHYVGAPPCPKGTLALLRGLEDLLDTSIPVLDLVEEARAWQTGVEELATEDEEVAEYIRSLEESQDTADLPEATGEAIAREFERYLRRREN